MTKAAKKTTAANPAQRAALKVNMEVASLRDIDRNINQIKTLSRRLDPLIHETAMAIMKHAKEHNDCSRAALLVDAMPKSSRRNALMTWFLEFSPIIVQGIKVKITGDILYKAKLAKEGESRHFKVYDIEGAQAVPFYEFVPEPEFKVLDGEALDKQVISLARRMRNMAKNGKVDADSKTHALALADYLEEALANFKRPAQEAS